jgi:hypothetical protein
MSTHAVLRHALLCLGMLLLLVQPVRAASVTLEAIAPSRLVSAADAFVFPPSDLLSLDYLEADFRAPALDAALVGIQLTGQTWAGDLHFPFNVARMALDTPQGAHVIPWLVILSIFTDAGQAPGQAGLSTGYLLTSDATVGPDMLGHVMSSAGWFGVGYEVPRDVVGRITDSPGVHMEITFPDTGYRVTGTTVRLAALQVVPEPATWGLLALGMGGLGALAWRRR